MVTVDLTKYKCHWCGTITGTFVCTCGYVSCTDCKLFPVDDKCVHRKYEKVESTKWEVSDVRLKSS